MKKIFTIVGARPQFIKASAVSSVFSDDNLPVEEKIIHTGQHFDHNMSNVFFDELGIPEPAFNLGIGGGTHGKNTGRMLENIENLLIDGKPDAVIVYGDTDSTLAGALAASKLHIPVAHIEAGLRSFNKKMPEEINRILTDNVSSLLFTPSDEATNNLYNEGFNQSMIYQSGDVMLDASMTFKAISKKPEDIEFHEGYILATIHRAENVDNKEVLNEIFKALDQISAHTNVIMPIHPRTKKALEDYGIKYNKIKLINPVSYLEMVWLLENCQLVITDSGGVQKEAYFFGKFCITTRNETEWVELVKIGANVLVGSNTQMIVEAYKNAPLDMLSDEIYGDGNASHKIVRNLLEFLD